MKKILIINGHPDKESYNYALADAYINGAKKAGAEVRQINIADLKFNPNLAYGYRKRTNHEPDLVDSLEKIKEADHLVWVFPMWWYGYPALMKGFIDRVFLPGLTFDYVKGSPFPKGLLKNKTARIIITSDTPYWYNKLFMGNPTINQFKKGTLKFCGIKPVKVTYIATIKNSKDRFRAKWLQKVTDLGKNLK
ncbi:NAD(P)H-dependent oxidoreductase [Crocinitomix algicola]|uniref:NAD(P)H-dependent oxidoreductase n=1 Tax=Crocinitomix algicola TaxID=1740263 RepID=UPI00082E56FA|nr:NAD(P)H-dependent oxidoreductase [Crocinitomix algicola]